MKWWQKFWGYHVRQTHIISYHIISYVYDFAEPNRGRTPNIEISGTVNVVKSKVSRDPVGRSEMLQHIWEILGVNGRYPTYFIWSHFLSFFNRSFNRSLNQLSSSILVEQHIVLALVKFFGIFQCGSHLAAEKGGPRGRGLNFYCLAEWRNRKTNASGARRDQRFGWFPNQPFFAWRVSFSFWSVLKNFSGNQNWSAQIGIDLAPWHHGLQKSFWKKVCYVSLLRKCIHLGSQIIHRNPVTPSDPAMQRSRGTKRRAFLVSGFLHIAWQDDTSVGLA